MRDELRKRGYDAEIGENGFEFRGEADRKEQTTSYYYDRLPTQEQIIGAIGDTIGSSAALKWDGNLLSLTAEQRKTVLKKLNNFGFDLAINDQGELYMVHNPANKTTYKTAYTPLEENGTTRESTTVMTTKSDKTTEPPEFVTGTTSGETVSAPDAEKVALSTFGGTGGDTFRHVIASKDGGYIVTAQFRSTDGDYAGTDTTWQKQKSAVVKYDGDGAVQWKATLGGKNIIRENGVNLLQSAELTDGSIIAVGNTGAGNLGAKDIGDALMVCYDANGSRKWLKLFSGSEPDYFESVCATPDGGFLVGGRTKSSDGDFAGTLEESNKAILLKFSADGNKEWMQTFNSGSTLAANFSALAVTDAGYIYAVCISPATPGFQTQLDMLTYAGFGGMDSIIFKFDPDGTLLTHRTIAGSGQDEIDSIVVIRKEVYMDYGKVALEKHLEWKGKIEISLRAPVDSDEALSLAYTPGVAAPCLEIQKDVSKSYEYTRRWNTVAVVTDGTAVLGLGDIGPEAGMPVMEGKCALFKGFGDVDAIPLCVRSKDVDDIVNRKMDQNEAKYPVEKARGNAAKYNQL